MDAFSAAVVRAYDRMPVGQRDQFDAGVRDFAAALHNLAALVERYEAEGIADVEDYLRRG